MSVVLTINGNSFDYPTTGDQEWGPEATDWAVAVTSGMLQKAGGLFQLLAETDFGTNYGLKSLYYKSRTSNPASAGQVRLARTDGIYWRNQANSGDLILGVDSSNNLTFQGNVLGAIGVSDTDSIDMTLSTSVVSADLNLSADPADSGFVLVQNSIKSDGLFGQVELADFPIASGSITGFLSNTDWTTFNNKQGAGNYITALTGDGTASGPGSAAFTLATVASAGTTGSSTSIPSVTINAKGLVTSVTGNAVVAPAGTLTGTALASNVVTSSLTEVGTIATGTWSATTIAVNKGGTGQTSYTDGQLLIGNSTGNTLAKATLTAGSNISITNGSGTITIASTAIGTTTSFTPTFTGLGTVSNAVGWYKIFGDTMRVWGSCSLGTPTAVALKILLPASKTINTSNLAANVSVLGIAGRIVNTGRLAATNVGPWVIFSDGSDTDEVFVSPGNGTVTSSSTSWGKQLGNDVMSSGDIFSFNFEVPIN